MKFCSRPAPGSLAQFAESASVPKWLCHLEGVSSDSFKYLTFAPATAGWLSIYWYKLTFTMMRRKRCSLRSNEPKFHHNVYVVLLSKSAMKDSSILRRNPKRDPEKPTVYVGLTGLPVDYRFENHKNGYKSARVVRKYGVRLLPKLYEHLNPMPYEYAVQMEKDLAEDLRAQGYAVAGGT
jgi:hypothetical protein